MNRINMIIEKEIRNSVIGDPQDPIEHIQVYREYADTDAIDRAKKFRVYTLRCTIPNVYIWRIHSTGPDRPDVPHVPIVGMQRLDIQHIRMIRESMPDYLTEEQTALLTGLFLSGEIK